MEDQPHVLEEIKSLREDVATLKGRLKQMHDDLEKAAKYRRAYGNRRTLREPSGPNLGRRQTDQPSDL